MRAKKVIVACANCGRDFLIPPCRVWREKSCSSRCKVEAKHKAMAASRLERTRACTCCGKSFVARQTQLDAGDGRYCSNSCAIKDGSLDNGRMPDARAKSAASWRSSFLAGKIKLKSGAEHPQWTGGKKAVRVRRQSKESKEVQAARTRRYRKMNPEKVREFTMRRRALRGKGVKLPAGTIARLLLLQGRKCAICKASVAAGYHVDHIYPIAKGGTHTPDNVQILCPTCNVRKSDKHPIRYMQERGMLL